MTRQERIHALQNNDLVFSRLAEESQELFKEVGKENIVFWNGMRWADSGNDNFGSTTLYRIKNEYKEAGTVSYPVYETQGRLRFKIKELEYGICDALNMARFSHYKYEHGNEERLPRMIAIGAAAEYPKFVVFTNE